MYLLIIYLNTTLVLGWDLICEIFCFSVSCFSSYSWNNMAGIQEWRLPLLFTNGGSFFWWRLDTAGSYSCAFFGHLIFIYKNGPIKFFHLSILCISRSLFRNTVTALFIKTNLQAHNKNTLYKSNVFSQLLQIQ